VKIIAGESMGVTSPVYTRTPTMYLDFRFEANTQFTQEIPEEFNAFLYILEGKVYLGEEQTEADSHHTIVLSKGDHLKMATKEAGAHFVLIGGKPVNEPVFQHGPFVMNTYFFPFYLILSN